METKKYKITQQALDKLEKEYDYLITVEREKIKDSLQEARALGDLSENSDYDDAKRRQTENEVKIAHHKDIIDNHIIINEEYVTIKFVETGKIQKYQLVGAIEADPLHDKISFESPLGKAVFGHQVGDVIEYTSGTGKRIAIEMIDDQEK